MPRPWQGKNRHRLKRELPFRSRQRLISRASADTTLTPGSGSLVLATFAPGVATPTTVVPGKLSLVLSEFAPVIVAPRTVVPGRLALTLATFAPSVIATSTTTRAVADTDIAEIQLGRPEIPPGGFDRYLQVERLRTEGRVRGVRQAEMEPLALMLLAADAISEEEWALLVAA